MEQLSAENLIHAHEILDLLQAATRAPSRRELQSQVESSFGIGARFTNCTGHSYDFDQIIAFLASRGKIVMSPDGITVCAREICDHD